MCSSIVRITLTYIVFSYSLHALHIWLCVCAFLQALTETTPLPWLISFRSKFTKARIPQEVGCCRLSSRAGPYNLNAMNTSTQSKSFLPMSLTLIAPVSSSMADPWPLSHSPRVSHGEWEMQKTHCEIGQILASTQINIIKSVSRYFQRPSCVPWIYTVSTFTTSGGKTAEIILFCVRCQKVILLEFFPLLTMALYHFI